MYFKRKDNTVSGLFGGKKKACERKAPFYNALFRSGGHEGQYHVHYTESMYFPVWKRIVEIISALEYPNVMEIGCGPGQFAHLLFDSGIRSYKGIDFSAEAIEMARKNVTGWAESFSVVDAFDTGVFYGDFTVVVLLEVLEHIENDLDLLRFIPDGKSVLFSVPSYSSESHVRRFKSSHNVEKRYKTVIDIIELNTFNGCPEPGKTIFLVYGTAKLPRN